MDEIRQKIEALAQKVFAKEGMELVDLKVSGHKNDIFIQITADKANGSINIRECGILNKALVAAIEQENVLPPEIFSLELSSPGLDRPLVTRKDFLRVKGMDLHFWLNEPLGPKGKKEAEGTLIEVAESELIIETSKKERLTIPLRSITKGLLVI